MHAPPAPGMAAAAASAAKATEVFKSDKVAAVADTPAERVNAIACEVLDALHATIRKHKVTYDEYNALKAWLINVGEDGEWPLFLDVWIEHEVEEVNNEHREGSKGTIEGPYYVPDRSEEHTSELQSLMRISYAVFCLKKKKQQQLK